MSEAVTPPDTTAEADGDSVADLVSGGLVAIFGAAVLVYIRGFPELPDGQPGPALFPGIIGGLLVVLGLTLVIRWGFHRRTASARSRAHPQSQTQQQPGAGGSTRGRIDALLILGAVVVYLLVVETVGFMVTAGVLLFALMWRLGARPVVAVAAAVLTTLAIVGLFQQLLLVPLPTGILG